MLFGHNALRLEGESNLVMVIGIRSYPDGFSYVILDGIQSEPQLIAKDRCKLPKTGNLPSHLAWVRRQLAEITDAHGLSGACIKATEPVARKKSAPRLQIEAVIIEYFATERAIDCQCRIKSQLKRDIAGFDEPARYLERVLSGSEELKELNQLNFQDACLAAVSELPV